MTNHATPSSTIGPTHGPTHDALRPRVLFVTMVASRPTHALVRAVALARRLDATLTVVVAPLPRLRPSSLLFPHRASRSELVALGDAAALDDKLAWVTCLAPGSRTLVVEGVVTRVAIEACGELEADLVVVSDEDLASPLDLAEIAEETGAPTLLARAAAGGDAVIAATDLRHADTPVLRTAADLGARLEAAVIAVHNVPVLAVQPMTPLGPALTAPPTVSELADRSDALDHATAQLATPIDRVLACEPRTVDAVLGAARARSADVVVVGTHTRSWLARLLFGSTARDVLSRARRSVLVVPIEDEGVGA